MGEFGNKFRRAREKKGLSFDDVSHVTKIGSRMLQAIEDERFERLPGGVFNKGFIRTYAKHLELNDEDAVNDYLACLRQAQIDAQAAGQAERPGQPSTTTPDRQVNSRKGGPGKHTPDKHNSDKDRSDKHGSDKHGSNKPGPNTSAAKSPAPAQGEELPELQLPRAEHVRPRRKDFGDSGAEIPWRMLAIAAVVIFLVIVLWMRRSHRTDAAATSSPAGTTRSMPASTPSLGNPPSASPSSSGNGPAPRSISNVPPLLHSASSSATRSSALAPASAALPAAVNHDTTAQTSPQSNPALSEKSTGPLTLVIRATETSWISVLADGQPDSHETLIAPARISVHASREIIVKVGNAAGVAFLWNGQEIPAEGAEAEVKTYVFDSAGMRSASPTQPAAPSTANQPPAQ